MPLLTSPFINRQELNIYTIMNITHQDPTMFEYIRKCNCIVLLQYQDFTIIFMTDAFNSIESSIHTKMEKVRHSLTDRKQAKLTHTHQPYCITSLCLWQGINENQYLVIHLPDNL